ncbi:MAG TPA: FKBP-type peptidyl-prolyl cis-trans isomerase [Candidatus Limnocylindrales bacterium]|nr:FKBP-type peptidyl-prolyl cis-trans isomerase [Candidatus Limnocylindrales bacterium]
MRINRLIGALVVGAMLATGLAACGGDEGGGDAAAGPCDVKVSGAANQKPTVTIPDNCDPPAELKTRDVSQGSGPAAKEGNSVEVNYLGVAWSTKAQFDSSWNPGRKPFVVSPLGQASVIAGWNQGLVGAKAGGRRLLVIPPSMGYGARGQGQIKPNETLVFVVDVVSIKG